jgi:4-hydroxy-4-methyl-2-oxoglutarate aldolase
MSTWIEYLKSIDTPTLINSIEELKLRPNREGFTPLELRCLFPEFGRMCGYAVTAQVESISQTEPLDLERFVELYRLVETSPKPAVIVLQEIGGFANYSAHCGEVMATFFKRLGAIGLVSDCAVRDIPEVRALGFHYFARGAVASHGNFRIVRSGVPVQVLGMEVKPGDILHGDENGLIQVPAGIEKTLPPAVDGVRARERQVMDFVRGDNFDLSKFLKLLDSMVVE